jgi:hypothetical protein
MKIKLNNFKIYIQNFKLCKNTNLCSLNKLKKWETSNNVITPPSSPSITPKNSVKLKKMDIDALPNASISSVIEEPPIFTNNLKVIVTQPTHANQPTHVIGAIACQRTPSTTAGNDWETISNVSGDISTDGYLSVDIP